MELAIEDGNPVDAVFEEIIYGKHRCREKNSEVRLNIGFKIGSGNNQKTKK